LPGNSHWTVSSLSPMILWQRVNFNVLWQKSLAGSLVKGQVLSMLERVGFSKGTISQDLLLRANLTVLWQRVRFCGKGSKSNSQLCGKGSTSLFSGEGSGSVAKGLVLWRKVTSLAFAFFHICHVHSLWFTFFHFCSLAVTFFQFCHSHSLLFTVFHFFHCLSKTLGCQILLTFFHCSSLSLTYFTVCHFPSLLLLSFTSYHLLSLYSSSFTFVHVLSLLSLLVTFLHFVTFC
jgi:hypothetical protein